MLAVDCQTLPVRSQQLTGSDVEDPPLQVIMKAGLGCDVVKADWLLCSELGLSEQTNRPLWAVGGLLKRDSLTMSIGANCQYRVNEWLHAPETISS